MYMARLTFRSDDFAQSIGQDFELCYLWNGVFQLARRVDAALHLTEYVQPTTGVFVYIIRKIMRTSSISSVFM